MGEIAAHQEDPRKLRTDIVAIEKKLEQARRRLYNLERACTHHWGNVEYDPIHHPGKQARKPENYDDFHHAQGYPARTEKRWVRTCTLCGKRETTTRTNKRDAPSDPVF